jgi:hypothetical protein
MPSGSLGTLGGLPHQTQEQLQQEMARFYVSPAVLQDIHNRGIRIPTQPASGYAGEMPADITSFDDEALGRLLNNISQYIGYVEGQLALIDMDRKSSTAAYEYLQARKRIEIKALPRDDVGRLTERDKEDMMMTDPRVIEAQLRVLYDDYRFYIVKNIRDAAQRDWESVSRRITQRGQDVQRQTRTGNVAGVPIGIPQSNWRPRSNGALPPQGR